MRTSTTRPAMIRYLSEHFRYHTMNSWNGSTSYARNVKLSQLKFPDRVTENRAWELLAVPEARHEIRGLMRQFAETHDFQWQAGFNGRSAGYLVLYSGGRRPTGHQSICTRCGQLNFQAVAGGEGASCGVCGEPRENLPAAGLETYTLPGLGLDMNQDFEDWDTDSLRARVSLVRDFDELCDRCISAFITFCQSHRAEKRELLVPAKVIVAVQLD